MPTTGGIAFGGLIYNIQIHLPESREQAVYDAIFRSLKTHMMPVTSLGEAYEFVFRGLLTDQALDEAGRRVRDVYVVLDQEYAAKLSLELLDEELVAAARRMATVYTAIASFENAARDLIASTMLEAKGEEWWSGVKADIRNRAETRMENEAKHKFHAQRGDAP